MLMSSRLEERNSPIQKEEGGGEKNIQALNSNWRLSPGLINSHNHFEVGIEVAMSIDFAIMDFGVLILWRGAFWMGWVGLREYCAWEWDRIDACTCPILTCILACPALHMASYICPS